MKDFLGRDIAEGDQIVYCTRGGSSMDMVLATVLVAGDKTLRVQPQGPGMIQGRRPTIYRDSRTGEAIGLYSRPDAWVYESHTESDCPPGCDQPKSLDRYYQAWHSGVRQPWVTDEKGDIRPVTLQASYYITKLIPYDE